MRRLFILSLLILLVLLPACSLLEGDPAASEGQPDPTEASPGPTPGAETEPESEAEVTPQPTEPAAAQEQPPLMIWVVEELSPAANTPGGSILAEQLSAYELNHPDVQLEVEVKAAAGRGGIVNYLRFSPNVAPGVAPDLIALPAEQLAVAAGEGLLVPLEPFIVQEERADLFPAALSLGQSGGQLFGYPMTLSNLTHMVYKTEVFTQTVPATWDELIAPDQASFVFPGNGLPGAELLLQMYQAEGGVVTDESNRPVLQLGPLTAALQRFRDGRASGAIPLEVSSFASFADSWPYFVETANSAQTVHRRYFTQQEQAPDTAFTNLPGPSGPLPPLVDGWAWAISASDPARQQLAADLLNWLIAGPNMGDWSRAASRLPARQSAFEQWPVGDDYVDFVQQQLLVAEAYPMGARGALLNELGTALYDVLSLASSPEAAAQAAVDALSQ